MDIGKLYFVKDEFYERFKNCGLLENKEVLNNKLHNRPCCYLFKFDNQDTDIYWMVPISSKIEKYKKEYNHSIKKYGMCDNISFCYILGKESAILPQNLFPITENYINNIYIDSNTHKPISIPKNIMAEVNKKARKKIRYNNKGKTFGMSDVMTIYNALLEDISQ